MDQMLEFVDPEAEHVQLPLFHPQIPSEDEFDNYIQPKPCCSPDQWEGYAVGHGSCGSRRRPNSIHFAQFYRLHYDYTGKRVAIREFSEVNGKRHLNATMIANYKTGNFYFIHNRSGKCKSVKFSGKNMRKGCVSNNATFHGSPSIGALSDSFKMNVFANKFRTKCAVGFYMASVTTKLCVPVSGAYGVRTRRGAGAMGISYFDITAGIKSESVFTPPKSCNQDLVEEISDEEMYDSFSDLSQVLHDHYVAGHEDME
jgi:hypothetical protein